jgi:uncharacterized lipoprotein YmbA
MSAIRITAILSVAFVMAACSIGKPLEQATTFAVEPAMPVLMPVENRRPEAVRMGVVRVAAAFSGRELVYRMDDVRYVSDPYNAFLSEPGSMFATRIAEWLDQSGPYRTVSQPGSARSAPYVLEATITELYGDFRPGQPPAGVLTMQFTLIDVADPRARVTFERTIKRRAALDRAAPDALVRGFNQALADVLTELASQL